MNTKFMQFWAPPDDDGGGGTVAEVLGDVEDDSSSEAATQVAEVETKPTPTTVDAAALAKEFGSVIGEHFKQQAPQQQQQKPLTPEEAKRLLNVWEPDDAFFTRFGNLDTQKAAIAEMRDALIKQADTIAQFRLQEQQAAWEQKFSPVHALIEQQVAEQRQVRFNDQYPQLANPALTPLLGTVIQQLHAGGKLSADESANFKAIADGVAAVIQATNPEFKLDAKASSSKKPSRAGIPVTTPGTGGGGGSDKEGEQKGVPLAVSFMSKIRA